MGHMLLFSENKNSKLDLLTSFWILCCIFSPLLFFNFGVPLLDRSLTAGQIFFLISAVLILFSIRRSVIFSKIFFSEVLILNGFISIPLIIQLLIDLFVEPTSLDTWHFLSTQAIFSVLKQCSMIVIPIVCVYLGFRTRQDYIRLLRYLFIVCVWSWLVGFVDFSFALLDVELVPRHIVDWVQVGVRFHGLVGEPRDLGNFWALTILLFHCCQREGLVSEFYKRVGLIITSGFLLLSFSTANFAGLIFCLIMLLLIGKKGNFSLALILLFMLVLNIFAIDRINDTFFFYGEKFVAMVQGERLGMFANAPDISIIAHIGRSILESSEVIRVFSGWGPGGSEAIILRYLGDGYSGVGPSTQLTRLFADYGILGTCLFVMGFFWVIKKRVANISPDPQELVLFLVPVFMFVSHRSYIFLVSITIIWLATKVWKADGIDRE